MKKLIFLIAVIMHSLTAKATILDIDFNGIDFLLGTFESAETGAQFYNYGSPWASSANPVYPDTLTPIPLEADALQIFAHTNTNTNQLSFGVILEKPNGSGGGTFSTTIDWSAPALLALVDDSGETGSLNNGGPQNINLSWIDCCTDGFVISGFDPQNLFIDLMNVTGSDLTKVIFLSPNRQNFEFEFPTDEFNISITNCDPQTDPNQCIIPVPEGKTVYTFFLGLLLLAIAGNRSKLF